MEEKTCQQCGKKYTPKSNNSKYCTKECKAKKDHEIRMNRYRNDIKYKEKWRMARSIRFKERYHNEPGFKEKHNKKTVERRRNSPKAMEKHRQCVKKYWRERYYTDEKFKEYCKQRSRNNYKKDKEKWRERYKKYMKTENGKIAEKKHKAKRRKLGTTNLLGNTLILPQETQPEFAHINSLIGAYLPKITHNLIPGRNKEQHQENTIKWVQKIYQLDLEKILK
jgi:hypothetical protein